MEASILSVLVFLLDRELANLLTCKGLNSLIKYSIEDRKEFKFFR